MLIKFTKYILLFISCFSFNQLIYSQAPTSETLDRIVAWVDDEIILLSDQKSAERQFSYNPQFSANDKIKCQIFETLVLDKILLAKAKLDSVYVEKNIVEQELDRRLSAILQKFGGDEKTILEAYGKTLTQLKSELRPTLKEQLVIQKMRGKVANDVSITPKEIKQFYKNIPKDSLPNYSTQVEIGHIVRYPKPNAESKKRTKKKLEDIKLRIENGEKFEDLAREFSQDPGSATRGGALGFFKRGELVPEYEAAALTIKPNELSKVVESQFGFHLIQLIERRGNEFNSRHILLKVEAEFDDLDKEFRFLDSIKTQILNDSLDFSVAANKFNEDPATKPTGGFLTDTEGNYRIAVEKLDASTYFKVDVMKIGEISKPEVFTDAVGEQAVKILFLKSKTPPHRANLSDDYQLIKSAALNSKKQRIMNEWFNETKKSIYVKIDENYESCKILANK